MNQVNITDITNSSDTGYFDQLMNSIEEHIKQEYQANRIKGSDYANVYLGSIQYALQQAFQFGLQKLQTEEQVRASQVQTQIAEEQNELDKALKIKQIEKINEDIESLNINDVLKQEQHTDNLVTTALDRTLKQTQSDDQLQTSALQRQQIVEQIESINLEDIIKEGTYEDTLLNTSLDRNLKQVQSDEQIASSQHERAIKQTQLDDSLLTSAKQRIILDTEELIKNYENEVLQPEQFRVSQFNTDLANIELNDKLVSSAKQREQLDEEIESINIQDIIKQEQSDKDLLVKQEQLDSSQHERSMKQSVINKDLIKITAETNVINQKYVGRVQ